MANIVPALLYIGNDSNQNVYTNSTQYAIVKFVNIANTGQGAKRFSLHIVLSGETPGPENAIIKNVDITERNVLAYDTSIVVPNNAALYVEQEDSGLTFTISGVEYVI